jgi:hypothetical protein
VKSPAPVPGFAAWFLIVSLMEHPLISLFTSGDTLHGVLPYLMPFSLGHILPYLLAHLAFAALYFCATGLFLKNTLNME